MLEFEHPKRRVGVHELATAKFSLFSSAPLALSPAAAAHASVSQCNNRCNSTAFAHTAGTALAAWLLPAAPQTPMRKRLQCKGTTRLERVKPLRGLCSRTLLAILLLTAVPIMRRRHDAPERECASIEAQVADEIRALIVQTIVERSAATEARNSIDDESSCRDSSDGAQ